MANGHGGKRKGAGRPKGTPKINVRVPVEVAQAIQQDTGKLENLIEQSKTIDFTGKKLYWADCLKESTDEFFILLSDLKKLGYEVVLQDSGDSIIKLSEAINHLPSAEN